MRKMLALPPLILLTGCEFTLTTPDVTPSSIVAFAESHGSGDLTQANQEGMRVWLQHNESVAVTISGMCGQVRLHADAIWTQTQEGKLCQAAAATALFRFGQGPVRGDTRTFDPIR